jgi:hypothetical protein
MEKDLTGQWATSSSDPIQQWAARSQQHSSSVRHCAARSRSWLAHDHVGLALVLTHTALGSAARLASAPMARGRMEVLTIGSRSRCEGDSREWLGLRGDGGLGRPCDGAWQSSRAHADAKRMRRCLAAS